MQDVTERLEEREAMLAELESGGYLNDPRLEEAMLSVPRHLFVPPELRAAAYEDRPLPIGFGQTVSAPHMVAMMTTALQLEAGQKVLEIGTGVGYHAAIVARVVGDAGHVDTVEFLPELVELARKNLKAAKVRLEVHEGDGAEGWAAGAPYDAIYVTCAIPNVPPALADQLKDGGHFVAPIGITRCQLLAGRKLDGVLELDDLGPCLFVNAQGALGAVGDAENMGIE
ncbi:MAG TPA: protein-L-isoaspartate O-methyltransferase [Candidatus Thermoplasmatota archaeon]|nr:protein-L-isoaspartate O-methyltransferase [Candidatus Thermoplasmatota archaeon]